MLMNAESPEICAESISAFAPTPAILSRISYRQTVARELAHKRYLENVYITSLDRLSDTEFLAGAFIPRSNAYINTMRDDSNDVTTTTIEIGRQISMAVAHEFLDVDYRNAFILNDMQFDILPTPEAIDWHANEKLLAYSVLTDAKCAADGKLQQVGGYIDFYVGTRCVFRQSNSCSIQENTRYAKLRNLMRTRFERSKNNGGDTASNIGGGFKAAMCRKWSALDDSVWIGADANRFIATLKVDRKNLFFFDHDNDHVPGMLLLEGMRQLAGDICMRFSHENVLKMTRMNLQFANFAELDAPVHLVATITRKINGARALDTIAIEARQLDKVAASGTFSLS